MNNLNGKETDEPLEKLNDNWNQEFKKWFDVWRKFSEITELVFVPCDEGEYLITREKYSANVVSIFKRSNDNREFSLGIMSFPLSKPLDCLVDSILCQQPDVTFLLFNTNKNSWSRKVSFKQIPKEVFGWGIMRQQKFWMNLVNKDVIRIVAKIFISLSQQS